MTTQLRLNTARFFAVAAGAVSFGLSAWGALASLGLDTWNPAEVMLALTFISPFPLFLLSIWSLRISAIALTACNISLYSIRAFGIHPNPQRNPFDFLGTIFICAPILMTLSYFLAPKDRRHLAKLLSGGGQMNEVTVPNDNL